MRFKVMLLNRRLLSKILITLLVCSSFPVAAITFDQLQQQLMEQPLLRGDFQQSKQLQMFNAPLISEGTFLLSHQKGLIWSQKTPFPVSLVLAKDKLRQQFDGQAAEVIEASDNPMVFYFSHLFLSLFKGDLHALESQFKMTLTEQADTWSLQLTPKQAPLDKVFKNIVITGNEQIEKLTLLELSGDSSTIKFSNIRTQPSTISKTENDAFNF